MYPPRGFCPVKEHCSQYPFKKGIKSEAMEKSNSSSGVPFIIANEVAERFSYYGMRSILVLYMTTALINSSGQLEPVSSSVATGWFHTFTTANYIFPLFGAILADAFLGKYLTIVLLSIVYCLGHLCLALDGTSSGLFAGLALIAIGAGGIKPCVSAHLGDQFDANNFNLLEKAYGLFYLGINLGALLATILVPYLFAKYSPHLAFGVPGIFMAFATVIFVLGRNRFTAVPPVGPRAYCKAIFSQKGRATIKRLAPLYCYIAVFWALFDQSASTWVLQAQSMNRNVTLPLVGTFELLSSQIQALNPLLIMLLVPVFTYIIYPAWRKYGHLSFRRKIAMGMCIAGCSFLVCAFVQLLISAGRTPSIYWHLLAYILLTIGEILISITALEFSYTEAPRAMKSFIMSFYLISVAAGNALTALLNFILSAIGASLESTGPYYYLLFSTLMWITSFLFLRSSKSHPQ